MRILTLTTLYPNEAQPSHGVFVENRLRAFADRHPGAEIRVIAPVPWVPSAAGWIGKYGEYARAPRTESRRGFELRHPRYFIPPKIGMTYAAQALERCFYREARRLLREGWDFDLIDAHYLYPDGIAAVRAAHRLGKPVVITARGTDVNLLPNFPRQRKMIMEAVRDANAIITVAAALKDELVRLGAPNEKISVLRNGVDLSLFRPLDRNEIRHRLSLSGDVIASVGHLIERKGHDLVIEAIKSLPEATLLIVGEGEERAALAALAHRLGVEDRVRFLGKVAHEKLAEIYNAADALALASSREGWPNVLLEAMACGTQAVATPVWGSGEVITAPEAGGLASERSANAMAEALRTALSTRPSREATRAYAERFSWNETSDRLQSIFEDVAENAHAARAVKTCRIQPVFQNSKPRLIVTIDTEEAFDWSRFDAPAYSVSPPEHIDRFQSLAASFGATPLYFLTLPIINDAALADYFRKAVKDGVLDLGLHLHQWVTPPLGGFEGAYYSFQCNLPPELHARKLRSLASAFEAAFGYRARAHRAGRYGISLPAYRQLAEIGVDLDFSPSVGFDFSGEGGPDFASMSNKPFEVDLPGARSIYVTPVCGFRVMRATKWISPEAQEPGFAPRRSPPLAAFTWPARLTCEGADLASLKRLTKKFIARGTPVLTFSLHSTTMTPGANPYAADDASVAANLTLCRDYFSFFRDELGGEFLSVDDLAAAYQRLTLTSL
ncbi:MAG: glycosyltransferase [Parvularculaceae bacterium]